MTVLENSGVYREYSETDLENALLILMEVFTAKLFDHHKDKLTQEQLEILCKEAGTSLRQTMILFTGIDMHEVVKKKWRKI